MKCTNCGSSLAVGTITVRYKMLYDQDGDAIKELEEKVISRGKTVRCNRCGKRFLRKDWS